MNGGYDLPNFVLIFALAILIGSLPTVLIARYMLTKKSNSQDPTVQDPAQTNPDDHQENHP